MIESKTAVMADERWQVTRVLRIVPPQTVASDVKDADQARRIAEAVARDDGADPDTWFWSQTEPNRLVLRTTLADYEVMRIEGAAEISLAQPADVAMDPTLLRLLQEEVLLQCSCLSFAGRDLQTAIEQFWHSGPADRVWFALQNLLMTAEVLSRLLWGSTEEEAAARAPLRQSLGVQPDSALAALKDHHLLDEVPAQIEAWFMEYQTHPMLGRKSIHPRVVRVGDTPNLERPAYFDPMSGEVTFGPYTVPLRLLLDESQRLRLTAAEAARTQT